MIKNVLIFILLQIYLRGKNMISERGGGNMIFNVIFRPQQDQLQKGPFTHHCPPYFFNDLLTKEADIVGNLHKWAGDHVEGPGDLHHRVVGGQGFKLITLAKMWRGHTSWKKKKQRTKRGKRAKKRRKKEKKKKKKKRHNKQNIF